MKQLRENIIREKKQKRKREEEEKIQTVNRKNNMY